MDFSNLTLLRREATVAGNGNTTDGDNHNNNRIGDGAFTVATFDGTRGNIPKADHDETEDYLQELEDRNNQQQLLLQTMNDNQGQENSSDGVCKYNVRNRQKLSQTPQPNLLQLVRGDIEHGSYFGFSTRLHSSPFTLPSISTSRPTSSSSQPPQKEPLDDVDATTVDFEQIPLSSSSMDLTGSSCFSRHYGANDDQNDGTQRISQRPSTTGGRFVETFRSSRNNNDNNHVLSSSTFAPSYTERNQLNLSSYSRSVPGSATTRGMYQLCIHVCIKSSAHVYTLCTLQLSQYVFVYMSVHIYMNQ